MSRLLVNLFTWLHDMLHQPRKILIACLVVMFFSLILEGSIFRLWRLQQDQKLLQSKIQKIQVDMELITAKLQRVSDPSFLEWEVRDQLDYVGKGDLIFVFSDKQ